MNLELFAIADYTDRQLYFNDISTRSKRPQNKLEKIPKPQDPEIKEENIGAIAQVGDRIAMGDHVWEVLELWPDFLVVSDGTRSKHVYRHELTSRKAYQVRLISQAQAPKEKGDRPLPKNPIAIPTQTIHTI